MSTKCKIKIKDFDTFNQFHKFIFKKPELNLTTNGELMHIKAISYASKSLQNNNFAERMGKTAKLILSQKCESSITYSYSATDSEGCGILCYAIYNINDEDKFNYKIASDCLLEKKSKPENIGINCAEELIKMIDNNILVDCHMQDNLIPILGLFGGKIKVGKITSHTYSNIKVCEKFLNVEYKIEEFIDKDNRNIVANYISVDDIL